MLSTLDMQILEILCEDPKVSTEELATMTGSDRETVQESMDRMHREGILVGIQTLVNWERTDRESVRAVIEVNVQPQREKGFDAIAQRIMQYEEVRSLYLMSGAYDLLVECEAATLRELAQFVHSRLSVIEGVTGTSTHFRLNTYKYGGTIFEAPETDRRQAVMP
ncbi:MAG: Lrp/AsnC family transcriptional regulator [Clostridia bacterium]|nr:Lrp/AsnC family transcriptional regulator [Clostridia bacterium]